MNKNLQDTQTIDIDRQIKELESITLVPVGIVRSPIKKPMLRANAEGLIQDDPEANLIDHHNKRLTTISEIWINPELDGILDGIDGFSHIIVLYWPHLVNKDRRSLRKVHPMGRKDIPLQGIYATCSPARPNPILITAVKLLECTKNMVRVQGLEAVDGSPVIDIKPYNSGYYRIENPVVPEWMENIH